MEDRWRPIKARDGKIKTTHTLNYFIFLWKLNPICVLLTGETHGGWKPVRAAWESRESDWPGKCRSRKTRAPSLSLSPGVMLWCDVTWHVTPWHVTLVTRGDWDCVTGQISELSDTGQNDTQDENIDRYGWFNVVDNSLCSMFICGL